MKFCFTADSPWMIAFLKAANELGIEYDMGGTDEKGEVLISISDALPPESYMDLGRLTADYKMQPDGIEIGSFIEPNPRKLLYIFLCDQGYLALREVPGRKWCGLTNQGLNWALWYGMDRQGKEGHYTFPNIESANRALSSWTGEGHPGREWIVHKNSSKGIRETNPLVDPISAGFEQRRNNNMDHGK